VRCVGERVGVGASVTSSPVQVKERYISLVSGSNTYQSKAKHSRHCSWNRKNSWLMSASSNRMTQRFDVTMKEIQRVQSDSSLQVVPDKKLFQKEGEVPSERNSNGTQPNPARIVGLPIQECLSFFDSTQLREMMIRMNGLGVFNLSDQRSALRDWLTVESCCGEKIRRRTWKIIGSLFQFQVNHGCGFELILI
jgi:hypothetical protein